MFKIYTVSDATGKTAGRVLNAALTQFDSSTVSIVRYGEVRSKQRVREIVAEAAKGHGFIVHTLVSEQLRTYILSEGRQKNVPTVDLMGPLLFRLSELLSDTPRAEPGLLTHLDIEYSQRIDAIEFTVQHDDGHRAEEIDRADIVLVGVSRTSKTPLSVYLANQGWKVANIPIVLNVKPPEILFQMPRHKVAALTITPERLAGLRKVRAGHMGTKITGYADLDYIRREVAFAYKIFDRRRDWPLIDVTAKPIEETASEIVTVLKPGS